MKIFSKFSTEDFVRNLIDKINDINWKKSVNIHNDEIFSFLEKVSDKKSFRIQVHQKETPRVGFYNYLIEIYIVTLERIKKVKTIYYSEVNNIFHLFLKVKYKYFIDKYGEDDIINEIIVLTKHKEIKWRKIPWEYDGVKVLVNKSFYYESDIVSVSTPTKTLRVSVYRDVMYMKLVSEDLTIHKPINTVRSDLYSFLKDFGI